MELKGIVGLPSIDYNVRSNLSGLGVSEATIGDVQPDITRQERISQFVTLGIPGVVAGFAETVGNSLGVTEDGDMEKFLKETLPTLGDFYGREKIPLQTTADITGLLVPGMIAIKALRGATVLARLINGGRKNRLLDTVFLRSGRFERTMQAIKNRNIHLAKAGVTDALTDTKRRLLAKRAQSTRISDIIKENLAFEAGVFATMNDSQTLYPDEFSTLELIALNAAFPGIFAVGSFIATGRTLRAGLADVSEFVQQARNPAGFEQPIARAATSTTDGTLDVALTVDARNIAELDGIIENAANDLTRTNLSKEQLVIRGDIKINTLLLGRAKPFAFTAQTNLEKGEVKTVTDALNENEFTMFGAVSIDVLPKQRSDQLEIISQRGQLIKKTEKELDETIAALAADDLTEITEPALILKADKLHLELEKLNSSELHVLDVDGSVTALRNYRPNGRQDITFGKEKATSIEPPKILVISGADTVFGAKKLEVGVTDDFQLILPRLPEGEVRISNINVTKVLTRAEISAPENFKEILRDMGTDWHLFTQSKVGSANRGHDVFKTLPKDIRDELQRWTSSPGASKIREWFDKGDPRAAQIMKAFEPMRQRLREIADADGTIPLLRGENVTETLNPTNDIVSMTSSPNIARQFGIGSGSNMIVRRVHPDDVIVIIGGLGQEFEYIVKGNLKRVAIPTEVKSSFEALTLQHRTAAFAGLQKAIQQFKPGKTKINLSADDHFTRFDAVLELHNKFGDSILDDITLPPSIANLEDLEFASVSRKYEELVRMLKVTEAKNDKLLKLSDEQILTHYNMARMLNMPSTIDGELPPLFHTFIGLHASQGDKTLREAVGTLDNLKRLVQENESLPEMLPFKKDNIELMGNQLSVPVDNIPVLVTKHSVSDEGYSRQVLTEAIVIERARIFTQLATASQKGGDLVQGITETVVARKELFNVARGVDTLTEGQQRGTQAISQFSHAIGENPAMNAIHAIRLETNKPHRRAVDLLFQESTPLYTKMKGPGAANNASLANYALYKHARLQGWDISETPIPIEGSKELFGFALDVGSKRNQVRFKKMFDREFTEGELMPTPGAGINGNFLRYAPLAVDDLTLRVAFSFQKHSDTILANKNVLREATGRSPIRRRAMHVPPVNFGQENVVFLMSDAGEVISSIPGRTLDEARAKARAEIVARGGGAHVVDVDDIERYFDLSESVFHGMRDFTDPVFQTGPITGKQVGITIDRGEEALNSSIRAYERQYESILRQTREVIFEPEMQFARKRMAATGSERGKKGLSIWHQYISAIIDRPTIRKDQLIGMSNLSVEKYYDNILSVKADIAAQFFNPPGLKKARATRREDKIYRNLEKSLGEHNPFQSAVDFANKTFDVKLPASMRRNMAALTHFTSFMTLRFMEVGHSVLTMTSLGATIPGVVAFMRITDAELVRGAQGLAEYQARIGSFGIPVDGKHAMFSPARALTTTISDWFTDKEFRAAIGRAGDQGYFDQLVSEAMKTITAPAEGYVAGIVRRAQDMVSVLSDKSERFARAWSFAVGYNIARRLGLQGDAVQFTMANNFANKVIGDFSPNNRPRIFQGATGMPLGLFMTFMWNYHQRLFSYIENGANRALATQVATQAAVFGGQTIPGFQQFSELFLTNFDGTANPIDGMNNRYGPEVTEALMMGTVSNISKLFGFEDGFNFSSRGDVNPRNFPTLLTIGDTPVFQMFQDFFNLTRETVGMLRTRGGIDDDQMADIIQSYSTNRFLRSQASLYTGFVTDRTGQVISSDTPSYKDILRGDIQNEMALIARMMGVRLLSEDAKIRAHTRNRSTDISRRYRLGELRDVFRSDFRSGKGTQESLEKGFEQYMRFGGSVDYFPRFMIEQFMRSKVDKTSLNILKILNNPQKSDNLMRLMNVL